MWGPFVHMYTKYEVSMSNPVARGGVHTNPILHGYLTSNPGHQYGNDALQRCIDVH